MTPDCGSGPVTYELTVAGAIGPVLRFALKPHKIARTQVCTILRARPSADRDLVDLMQLLESRGLKVDDVSRVDTPGRKTDRLEGRSRHRRWHR